MKIDGACGQPSFPRKQPIGKHVRSLEGLD
jgi:hypothetical protein